MLPVCEGRGGGSDGGGGGGGGVGLGREELHFASIPARQLHSASLHSLEHRVVRLENLEQRERASSLFATTTCALGFPQYICNKAYVRGTELASQVERIANDFPTELLDRLVGSWGHGQPEAHTCCPLLPPRGRRARRTRRSRALRPCGLGTAAVHRALTSVTGARLPGVRRVLLRPNCAAWGTPPRCSCGSSARRHD